MYLVTYETFSLIFMTHETNDQNLLKKRESNGQSM